MPASGPVLSENLLDPVLSENLLVVLGEPSGRPRGLRGPSGRPRGLRGPRGILEVLEVS